MANLLSQYEETSLNVYLVELSEKELPKEDGFGFLVPSCEDKSLLGVTFDSCVFPEHDSPQGNFIGYTRGDSMIFKDTLVSEF